MHWTLWKHASRIEIYHVSIYFRLPFVSVLRRGFVGNFICVARFISRKERWRKYFTDMDA
jgi:hypothetical protein